jgi:hypothetical protein
MWEYKWSPRDVDELTLPELFNAYGMVGRLRRERIRDMAIAMRMAQIHKQRDWTKALEELER